MSLASRQISSPISITATTAHRAAFFLYIFIAVFSVLNHECWADEAQAWLVARDTSITQMLSRLPTEGHPPLWYLLLCPLAKAGLPYESIKWLTLLIMLSSVYIFIFKTSIPLPIKLSFPFSYFILFQYTAIARNYCLVVFFICLIISLYPLRFKKPVYFGLALAGLFNSHVLVFGFCGGLLFLFIIDAWQERQFSKATMAGITIAFACGAYLIPYLAFSPLVSYYAAESTDHSSRLMLIIKMGILAQNSPAGYVFVVVLLALLLRNLKTVILFLAGVGGVLYILCFKFVNNSIWHYGVLFTVLFGCFCVSQFYRSNSENSYHFKFITLWLFPTLILFQLPQTANAIELDAKNPYSGSKEVVDYLVENDLDKKTIVTWGAGNAIAAYLPPTARCYNAECQKFCTYYSFDSCFMSQQWAKSPDHAVKVAHDNFQNKLSDIVLVLNYPMPPATAQYLDLLYNTQQALWPPETFYVYKFKENVK